MSWFNISLPPRAASLSWRARCRVAEQLGPAPGNSPSSRGCSKTRSGTGRCPAISGCSSAGWGFAHPREPRSHQQVRGGGRSPPLGSASRPGTGASRGRAPSPPPQEGIPQKGRPDPSRVGGTSLRGTQGRVTGISASPSPLQPLAPLCHQDKRSDSLPG